MQPYDQDSQFPGTVNPDIKIKEEDLLGQAITSSYVPYGAYGLYGYYTLMNRNRPPFSYLMIRDMLADPKVLFGLWLIKGPIISQAKFNVKTNNSAVEEFVQSNLKRFWMNSAARVLKAIEWGYSASEVHYRYNPEDGLIHFDRVRDLESLDCRPVTVRGVIVGFTVRGFGTINPLEYSNPKDTSEKRNLSAPRYVGCPKGLWHLHSRDRNPWFGLSRLYGVHVPWWEQWSEDGYRSIRRLWFAKNAYEGGIIYHPPGNITTPMGPMPARDYARELIEKKRTGGILTFPNTPAGDGQGKAWEYMPPTGNPIPAGLLEYGESLDAEVLQALGIPPEVIQASGETGFGSASGRQVPQMAFFSVLQELVQWLVMDFNDQCLRYLVTLAFGPQQYEIEVLPLGDEGVTQDPNDPNGDENPLAEEGGEEGNLNPDEEKALRSKASEDDGSFGMSWVTVGGKPDAKSGAKHKGGTPVNIEGGKVVAGGPPKWRGKPLKQAVSGGQSDRPSLEDEGFDPEPHEEFERIREAVGDDPELQEGLTRFANEALSELTKRHESFKKVYDYAKELEAGELGVDEGGDIGISDSYQAQEGEEGEDVQKRLEARKKALKAREMRKYRGRQVGRTPEAVARAVQKKTGIHKEEYEAYEEEYWNRHYMTQVDYQKDLLKLRQFVAERTGRKDFGELEDMEVESIAEKINKDMFPHLGGLVPQTGSYEAYAPTADVDTVLDYVNREVPKIPSRLSREYVAEVLRGMLADNDLDPHKGITDRRVMKVAMDKLNKHKNAGPTVAYEEDF